MKAFISQVIRKYGFEISRLPQDKSIYYYNLIKNEKLFFSNTEIKGLNLLFRTGSSDFDVFKQVILRDEYRLVVNLLKDLVQMKNGVPLKIIDAGANVGFTSLYFSSLLDNIRIISIEPDNNNFHQLEKHVSANKLDKKITPINAALWSDIVSLRINRNFRDGKDWSISVSQIEQDEAIIDGIKGYPVCYFIDKYFDGEIDLLKIDIEGGERLLFDNEDTAGQFLKKTRLICLEVHDEVANRIKIYNILRRAGFVLLESAELTIGIKVVE